MRICVWTVASLAALLVAACGQDGQPATPDGGVDAFVPDADPHGPITATVLDVLGTGAIAANIPVIFVNPDGEIVGDTTSDASGRVSATILPGASVTTVWNQTDRYTIVTVFDVKPGDDLVLGYAQRDATVDPTAFTVTFPALAGASSYVVVGPCGPIVGAPDTPVALGFRANCKPQAFDVYVVARDTNSEPFKYAEKLAVHLGDGAATIAPTWLDVGNFQATYTHVPVEVTDVNLSRRSGTINGYVGTAPPGTPTNGTLGLGISPAIGAGQSAFVSSIFTRPAGQQTITQRLAGTAFSDQLDVGASLLPWFVSRTFDLATRTFTPTLSAGGQPFDVMALDQLFARTDGTLTTTYEWIVLSPVAGPITLPPLPAHLADLNPRDNDSFLQPIGYLIDTSEHDGWDATRPDVFHTYDSVLLYTSPADLIRSSVAQ